MKIDKLREATKTSHSKLESNHINTALFKSESQIEYYVHFLQVQYSLCVALENKISPHIKTLATFSIDFVSRAKEIKLELDNMKISPTIIEINLSKNDSFFTAICCLYLLEGSRHGAFKILHYFQSVLPQDYTFYFLHTNVESFHKKWGTIIHVMNSLIEDDEIFNEMVITINDMYKSIEELYDDYSTINKLR